MDQEKQARFDIRKRKYCDASEDYGILEHLAKRSNNINLTGQIFRFRFRRPPKPKKPRPKRR
ncbi:hypothetical protein BGZ76_004787 [Entomortierella beljakovae]|nr:hypothetical protein BGZ76_004787 [Entomortierella beljakovae]